MPEWAAKEQNVSPEWVRDSTSGPLGVERKGHRWGWGSGKQALNLARGLALRGSADAVTDGEPAGVVEMRVLDSLLS